MAGKAQAKAPAPSELAESLSALADGQLPARDLVAAADHIFQGRQVRLTWYSYHLLGDILRTGHSPSHPADAEFFGRFASRLAAERPYSWSEIAIEPVANTADAARPFTDFSSGRSAANEAYFSWRTVAGFLGVMLFASLGWQIGMPWAEHARGAQLASTKVVAPVGQPVPVPDIAPVAASTLLRDPELDAVMQAQRAHPGSPVLPGVNGRVRNATFQGAGR